MEDVTNMISEAVFLDCQIYGRAKSPTPHFGDGEGGGMAMLVVKEIKNPI
jgi:hypothetical protein